MREFQIVSFAVSFAKLYVLLKNLTFHTGRLGRTCFSALKDSCLKRKKLTLRLRIVFIIATHQRVRECCDDNSSENHLVVLIAFFIKI